MNMPTIGASTARRVLIIDDEPNLRTMLTTAIASMHYEPASVPSAEAATRLMQKESFDILLLDLNLPGINGMEFLEVLSQTQPCPQVIIHTGFGCLEDAQRALRLKAIDFLTKPCTLAELEQALNRARNRQIELLQVQQLSEQNKQPSPESRPAPRAVVHCDPPSDIQTLEEMERNHILSMLDRNGGNRALTAEQLGISLRTLYYRLEQYQKSGHIR